MRSVSEEFKAAMQSFGRRVAAEVTAGGEVYAGSDIVSIRPYYDGGLCRSVMRGCDIELDGVTDIGTTAIDKVRYGVLVGAAYEYIDLGSFIVDESEVDKAKHSVVLKCYDHMITSMIPYDMDLSYPMTVGAYLSAVCARLGWPLASTTFVNSTVEVEEEKYDESYTIRDVLDDIAEVAAGTLAFVGDTLTMLYPTACGETYTAANMDGENGLTIGAVFGPVNSVVLARAPQEDNIYRRDNDSILANGLTEYRIEDNQIMDSHREDFIDAIFTQLYGITFTLNEWSSYGFGWVNLCDYYTLEDQSGNTFTALMLADDMTISQGISEESVCEEPDCCSGDTDYEAASESDRVMNKTILRVDKQDQVIESLVTKTEAMGEDVGNLQTRTTTIEQNASEIAIAVTGIVENGVNKVTTETGYTFDKDGLSITKSGEEMENLLDNTGMYVKRDGETILQANNAGVIATDVTVRNYLVIGTHARFEDYSDGRTACFYLGG